MNIARMLFIPVIALFASSLAAKDTSRPAPRMERDELNSLPNTPGDGPYPATIGVDPGLVGHVIYRPADLTPFKGNKLPVVIWGNGACADDGTAHRFHLAEIASYGYVVIAAGHWRSGPGAVAPPLNPVATSRGNLPPPATSVEDLRSGLDWVLKEDSREGSVFKGIIAQSQIAVAGHSCGGLQAIELADDPRIKTVMVHNSGIYNSEVSNVPTMRATKDMLRDFHQPVIYILGGQEDIAYPNGTDDFARIDHVPTVLASLPVGHGGTFSEPMGGAVAHVSVDWLEWQLKSDQTAARTFLGENCRLCTGTKWKIETKGF